MKPYILKLVVILLLLLSNLTFSQSLEITSVASPIKIVNSSGGCSLIAMGGPCSYSLNIQNTSVLPISGEYTLNFPVEFQIIFPAILPPEIQITGTNPYVMSVNSLAASGSINLNYSIQSCFLADFGSHLTRERTIIYSSADPNIIINTTQQNITVARGQSLAVLDPSIIQNNEVFFYEGTSYTRAYHISSNGSTNTPFTGVIEFTDILGTALDLEQGNLQIVLPLGNPQPLNFTNTNGEIKASIDIGALLPQGLPVGAIIEIMETVRIARCLDGGAGNSTVTINWKKDNMSTCEFTARTISPTAIRPSAPLLFPISYPPNGLYSSPFCYSTDVGNTDGHYTNTKRFENNIVGNNFENARLHLLYAYAGNGLATKIPLNRVRLVRNNELNPLRDNTLIVDFQTEFSNNPPTDFNDIKIMLQKFSSIFTTNDIGEFYRNSAEQNIIHHTPAGNSCSSSEFQVVNLYIDRFPDGNGGFVYLNFEEGDVYDFIWDEIQCCRTYELALDPNMTTRWGKAGVALEYPLCGSMNAINGDNGPNWYLNILELFHKFKPNTTKIYAADPDRNPSTRDGQIGELHIENIIYATNGMDSYPLLDGSTPVFMDVDILFTEGLTLDIRGDLLPTIYDAAFRHRSGIDWEPISITDNSNTLIGNPLFLTNHDNIKIPVGQMKPVTEIHTLRFDMNELADLLNLTGEARNVAYIIKELAEAEFFSQIRAIKCPQNDLGYVSFRSYLVNRPTCNDCRNLMASASFDFTLNCPGCRVPGPEISRSTSLRDISSLGPLDNDNDGVQDIDQTGPDRRNRSVVRLSDFLNTTITAGFPDGDDDGGFTYSTLLTQRPEYVQDNGYLRATFNLGSVNGEDRGGLELRKVVATLRGNSITVLDLENNIIPASGRIKLKSATAFEDYATAPIGINGLKTANFNTFYFRVGLEDFDITDTSGFNYGADGITFEVIYQVVKDLVGSDNIIVANYLVYTAKDSHIYPGHTPNIIDALDIGSALNLPPNANIPNIENAFFWCTGGQSIFGYVKYNAINTHYLQDPFVQENQTINSCTKIMHLSSEAFPINAIGGIKYNAFENEYRTVNHPLRFDVQIPQDYTMNSIELINSNTVSAEGGRRRNVTESMNIPIPAFGPNNVISIQTPNYSDATLAEGSLLNVSSFQSMDELNYNELVINLTGACDNVNIPDIIYWTPDPINVPIGIPTVGMPIIELQSLPIQELFLPAIGATQEVESKGNRNPGVPKTFYFIKPKTDITLANNGSQNVTIRDNIFDFGVRVSNTPAKDALGNPIPNPYNPTEPIYAIAANHTFISFATASLPSGFIIDFIYESENAISPLPINNRFLPLQPTTDNFVFDLGNTNPNSQRNFRIVGHYDCSVSGCDPFSETLVNCMLNTPISVNYGWNCSAPNPLSPSSCDVNTPLIYTFSNSPVKVNVTVPITQTLEYCETYTHSTNLRSLENGSISGYTVSISLPVNAQYVANSSTVSGIQIDDQLITINNNELTYDISGLRSNIQTNSETILNLNYVYNCVSAGSEISEMNQIITDIESTTYCNSTDTRQFITTIVNNGVANQHYDDIQISSMQCTSGYINQGVFESIIKVQNASSTNDSRNQNFVRVTLPAGVTLDASTTPGYIYLSSNVIEWEISNDINVIPANTFLSDIAIRYSIGALTSCSQDFVFNAEIIGNMDLTCSNNGLCIVPKVLSIESCTTTAQSSTYVGISTVSGNASFLCDGSPVVFKAIPSSMLAPFEYQWYLETPINPGTYTHITTNSNVQITAGNPNGSDNLSVSLIGRYKVVVADVNGCEATNYATVVDNMQIECPEPICPGEKPPIKVLNFGGVVGTYNAQWYDPNGTDTNDPADLAADILMENGILTSGYYYAAAITPSCTLRTNQRTPQACPIEVKRAPNAYHITSDRPSGDAPLLFLCDGDTTTLSVTNPDVNNLFPTDVVWRSGQTTTNDVIAPGSWSNPGNLLTAQELENGAYFIVAIDEETGCRTQSNEIKIETPRIVIRRTCESGSQVKLTAVSNFNVLPTEYDWQYNGTPLAQGTNNVVASQMGVYTVVEHSTGCTLSNKCWGIQENLNTTATPNQEMLSIQSGGFEGILDCQSSRGFDTDFDCIDRSGYTGGILPADYTIGKFMINQNGLQASDWSPNTPSTWVNSNTTYDGDGAMFIDGESEPSSKLIWGKTVPVEHGINYLYRFKVRNIEVLSQYPIREIPELYVQITYIDDLGNGTRYKTGKQALFNSGNTPWIEFSSYTPALPFIIPNCLSPTEIESVHLELFMDGGGAIGRDIAVDDVSLIPIGICDDVIQLNLPCNAALADLDNTQLVICPGSSAQFNVINAPSGLTYLWQGDVNGTLTNLGTSSSFTTPVLTLSDPDRPEFFPYQLTITDPINNCVTRLSATAVVATIPKLSITSALNGNNCEKEFTAVFNGLGTPSQFDWYLNNTLVSGVTGSVYTAVNLQGGDIVQCKVSGVWCSGGTPVESNGITISSTPTIIADAGVDKIVCHGTEVSIGAASQTDVVYRWDPIQYLDDATNSNPTIGSSGTVNETSLTYSVTAIDAATGCIGGVDEVIVTVNPLPELPAISGLTSEVCEGSLGSFTIEREAGLTYKYSTPLMVGATVTIPSGTGPYLVNAINVGSGGATISLDITIVNDATQCIRSVSYPITVKTKPIVSGFSPTVYICQGGTYSFSVADHSGSAYTWDASNGATISTGQGTNAVTITFPNSYTDHDITIVETANGCVSDLYTYQATVVNTTITAGNNVTICQGQSVSLIASQGLVGGYNWTTEPASSASYMSFQNGSASPLVTPIETTIYTLTSSIYGCPAIASVTVTVNPLPDIPTINAGGPTTVCQGTNVALSTIATGVTYQWKLDNVDIAGATANSFDATVSGSYSLVITNGNNCSATSTAVNVVVNPLPPYPTFNLSSTNVCLNGTLNISNGAIPIAPITYNIVRPAGAIILGSGAGGGFYWEGLQLTISGSAVYSLIYTNSITGCTNINSQTIEVGVQESTTAFAGIDQTVCGTTATLAGTTLPGGTTGTWSIRSGSGTITTPNSPTSTLTGLVGGNVTLRWTSVSPTCTTFDDVVITSTALPTTSDANNDQSRCNGSSNFNMSANNPSIGTGLWSLVSGNATINNPSSRNTSVVVTAGNNATLRWTITNGACSSTDDLVITHKATTTTANAGPDKTACSTTTNLEGNSPLSGTGEWTKLSGPGNITTPSSPTSAVTSLGGFPTTFRWTISNAPCPSSIDDVIITLTGSALPTTSNAGPDQNRCNGPSNFTMSANNPSVGTGLWSLVSGSATINNPSSRNTSVTVTAGNAATLRWTITNGACSSIDNVLITNATLANAGPNQVVCTGIATLAGNTPTSGTGTWTLVGGTAAITTPSSPTSQITGLVAGSSATLRWTTNNAPCPLSQDDIVVSRTSWPCKMGIFALEGVDVSYDLFSVKAEPNPYTDQTILTVTGASEDYVKILILDVNGKVLFESSKMPNNNSTPIGDGLPSGMHILKVIDGDIVRTLKIIRLK